MKEAEKTLERGKKAEKEAFNKGLVQPLEETARRLLKSEISIDDAAYYTNLPKKREVELKQELQKE